MKSREVQVVCQKRAAHLYGKLRGILESDLHAQVELAREHIRVVTTLVRNLTPIPAAVLGGEIHHVEEDARDRVGFEAHVHVKLVTGSDEHRLTVVARVEAGQ